MTLSFYFNIIVLMYCIWCTSARMQVFVVDVNSLQLEGIILKISKCGAIERAWKKFGHMKFQIHNEVLRRIKEDLFNVTNLSRHLGRVV